MKNPTSELGNLIGLLNNHWHNENPPFSQEERLNKYSYHAQGFSFTRQRVGAVTRTLVAVIYDAPSRPPLVHMTQLHEVKLAVMVHYLDDGDTLVRVNETTLAACGSRPRLFRPNSWNLNEVTRLVPTFNSQAILAAATAPLTAHTQHRYQPPPRRIA